MGAFLGFTQVVFGTAYYNFVPKLYKILYKLF